jgi:two-component system, NtrC family, sensor kinase
VIVLGTLYAWTVGSRLIGRPTRRLVAHFRRVGGGDLAPLATTTGWSGEMAELAVELDVMVRKLAEARALADGEHAARLAALEQLRHADRLTTVGKLASGVAHELGTPLNVISGYAKLIATGQEQGAEATESARIIGEQTERVTAIVRQLLDFARRGELKPTVIDVRSTVARALRMVDIVAKKVNVTVRYDEPAEPLMVELDDAKFQQVTINLAINAIQASRAGGVVELSLARARARRPGGDDELPCVRLDFVDHGEGIARELLDRVFEPFFTTKPVGEGTGLGLAVSHGIVDEHHGWIAVASEPGQGSTFSVYLPEAKES